MTKKYADGQTNSKSLSEEGRGYKAIIRSTGSRIMRNSHPVCGKVG